MKPQRLNFDGPATFDPRAMTIAPSVHPQARETSALAAVANQPRRVTQNMQLIALLQQAGERGLADPVIQRLTGWSRQTICARRGNVGTVPAATRWMHRETRLSYTRWRLAEEETNA